MIVFTIKEQYHSEYVCSRKIITSNVFSLRCRKTSSIMSIFVRWSLKMTLWSIACLLWLNVIAYSIWIFTECHLTTKSYNSTFLMRIMKMFADCWIFVRTALAETWPLKGRLILNKLLSSVFLSAMLTEGFRENSHDAHGRSDLWMNHLKILRKCQGEFDCLVLKVLYIKKFKHNLNVQADSEREKLFV